MEAVQKVGLDSSFFVRFQKKEGRAVELYEEMKSGSKKGIVSVISVTEIVTYMYKRGMSEEVEKFISLLNKMFDVINIDVDIAYKAAGTIQGVGLHLSDALILESIKSAGCKTFYTTDSDFKNYRQKDFKVYLM